MATNTPLQATRAAVRRRLPKLIRKAMTDYAAFAAQPAPDDAKAALAHLDAGAKLLTWAEGSGPDGSEMDDLARLIKAAEDAVSSADPDNI